MENNLPSLNTGFASANASKADFATYAKKTNTIRHTNTLTEKTQNEQVRQSKR